MESLRIQLETSFIQISDLFRDSDPSKLEDYIEKYNISGDDVKQADILANVILRENLSRCSLVRAIASEEESELIETSHKTAPYLVSYDPLDGSTNIGVNITTGTIFGVYKYDEEGKINSGRDTVLAGYCLYGAATQFVVADEEKVTMYQLKFTDENKIIREFVKIQDHIKIPKKGMIYSINESNKNKWVDNRYSKIINWMLEKNYTTRWVGALVADAHRTLLKGGIFSYPATTSNITGKIRLLYEAYPFAFIFEKAGGKATNGDVPLLDVAFPKHNIHLKTPIVLASCYEMLYFENFQE